MTVRERYAKAEPNFAPESSYQVLVEYATETAVRGDGSFVDFVHHPTSQEERFIVFRHLSVGRTLRDGEDLLFCDLEDLLGRAGL